MLRRIWVYPIYTPTPTTRLEPTRFFSTGGGSFPKLRAVAIAHKLIHAEHGHSDMREGQHSILRHLLIIEEGEAHL